MEKDFKIKVEYIVHSDEKETRIKPLFICDPEKNTECGKTLCGKFCTQTDNIQFAKEFDIND